MPEVLEAASLELRDASTWYEDRRPGYGDRFLNELATVFERIERMRLREGSGC